MAALLRVQWTGEQREIMYPRPRSRAASEPSRAAKSTQADKGAARQNRAEKELVKWLRAGHGYQRVAARCRRCTPSRTTVPIYLCGKANWRTCCTLRALQHPVGQHGQARVEDTRSAACTLTLFAMASLARAVASLQTRLSFDVSRDNPLSPHCANPRSSSLPSSTSFSDFSLFTGDDGARRPRQGCWAPAARPGGQRAVSERGLNHLRAQLRPCSTPAPRTAARAPAKTACARRRARFRVRRWPAPAAAPTVSP